MELGMNFFITNILLGVGLAMDAFSVSLANGLHEPRMKPRKAVGIALIFAGIYHLWQFLRYQVQCLRYPPPPGGMYGNMARMYKNKRR